MQAGADSVWSNDLDSRNREAIVANTTAALAAPRLSQATHPHLRQPITEVHAAASPAAGPDSVVLRGRVSNLDGPLPLRPSLPPAVPLSIRAARAVGAARAVRAAPPSDPTPRPRSSSYGSPAYGPDPWCLLRLCGKPQRKGSCASAVHALPCYHHADATAAWSRCPCHDIARIVSPQCVQGHVVVIARPVVRLTQHTAHTAHGTHSTQRVLHAPPPRAPDGTVRLFRAARRLLTACYLNETFADIIDADMFGSDTSSVGPALDCLRFGGLLYLTSTDGFSSSGKRPARALAAYAAYTQPLPFHAEQGLRALVGGAVREAATRGLRVQPLFCLYSPHGPVMRAMVRVTRQRVAPGDEYGFVGYEASSGEVWRIPFRCGARPRVRVHPHPCLQVLQNSAGQLRSSRSLLCLVEESNAPVLRACA